MKHILTPSEQSKEDLNSNISGIPDPSLPTETSCEALIAATSNNNSSSLIFSKTLFSTSLPRSKCFSSRHFSQPYFQARNFSASKSIPNIVCSPDEVDTAASSSGQVSATPMKELNPIENQNGLPMKSASVQTCFSFIERDRPHRKFAHKRC
ncbi:hypothetical protein ACFX15_003511 [Malus domestica]